MHREHAERGFVVRERDGEPIVARVGVAEVELGVCVDAGHADDWPATGQRRPVGHRILEAREQTGQRFRRPDRIVQQSLEQSETRSPPRGCMHAPARIGVDPLDAFDGRVPVVPPELRLGRIRMRGNPEPAEPSHVLHDVARLTGERIRRRRHVEHDVVPAAGADLHAIETQHARSVNRRVGRPGPVAVIGEDDERDAGACRGRGYFVGRAPAVGSSGVNVEDAGDRSVGRGRQGQAARRQCQARHTADGGREGRHRCHDALHSAR